MIKFGVIGCGNVSGTYLYTLDKNKSSKVMAVVDNDIKRLKKVADAFNVPNIYSDYRKMLKRESLDAVVIATPPYFHHDQIIDCFDKGLNVLCEKPLATSSEEIYNMVEKGKRVKFGVMLQRRFYPNSDATKKVISEKRLGKIEEVSLNFSCHKTPEFYNTWRGKAISGGGTLMSQALHRIDRLVYFFGSAKYVEGYVKTTRDYIEVEDYAKGKIFFHNGIVADIESNNSSGDPTTKSTIKIKGSKGSIILSDDKTPEWNVLDFDKPNEISVENIPSEYRPPYYGPAHEKVIDNFVGSVLNDKKLKITGEDSILAMNIIFGFYKSAKESRKIHLE